MKITILAAQVIGIHGVAWRGDQVDWPEKDCRPMLDVREPSAVEGWVDLDKPKRPKRAKPEPVTEPDPEPVAVEDDEVVDDG